MAANQQTSQNKRFFKLIAKAEKADLEGKKAICEQVKDGETYRVKDWYSSLSGFITGLSTKELEYQGKKNKIIVMELTDSEGVFQLEFSFSGASYSIINSLLGADFTKEFEIGAWIKDGKYVNTSVKYVGGEKVNWVLQIADQPKPFEFEHPVSHKMEKDFTNVTNFWIEKFESLTGKAVKSNFKGNFAAPQNAHTSAENHHEIVDGRINDASDVPF
jgi:hypothetical protein